MKIEIEVKDEAEARALKTALSDPETRALAVTVGLLLPMTPRARKRTMHYVTDAVDEMRERAAE